VLPAVAPSLLLLLLLLPLVVQFSSMHTATGSSKGGGSMFKCFGAEKNVFRGRIHL